MGALEQTEASRLAALQEIGTARDSVVISYMTSIRESSASAILDADNRVLERHLEMAAEKGAQNIDLFICTYGGDGSMGWNFHTLFREYFPNGRLGVFVPYFAYSAGTQICLGCDEIIMGKSSVLGPVDTPQYGGVFGGLMDLVRETSGGKQGNAFDQILAASWGEQALKLGYYYRMWKEDRRVIKAALETRRKPLGAKENDQILDFFLHHVGFHGQGVRRKEAVKAGLSFIKQIEDTGLETAVRNLFRDYASVMKLFEPFDKSKKSSEDRAPGAIIESEFETNVAYISGRMDRQWEPATPGDHLGINNAHLAGNPAGTPDGNLDGLLAAHAASFGGTSADVSWSSTPHEWHERPLRDRSIGETARTFFRKRS